MDKLKSLKINLGGNLEESKVINSDSLTSNHPMPDLPEDEEKFIAGEEIAPKRVVELEMSINPHFKNWDPLHNLKMLKSRVHQIIKAERFVKLENLIKSLQGNEGSFIMSEKSDLTAFEVDPVSRKIYLGFKNGKFAIIDLNSERPHPEKTDTHLISCAFLDLKTTVKIEDIFLIDEDELLIVFKDQISVLFLDFDENTNMEDYEADLCLLFHNILDAGTEHMIKEVRFLPEHKMFYLMIEHGKHDRMFIRFKIEGEAKMEMYRQIFPKLITKFEVHVKNPNILYLILENEVYQLDITKRKEDKNKKEDRKNDDTGAQSLINMPKSTSYFNFSLRETAQQATKKRKERKRRKKLREPKHIPFFANPKKNIRFFKFNPNMKFFFCNEGRFIKKYQTDSKKLIQTYEGHQHDLKNIEFSEDFEFMFSLDKKGIVKIWNLKKSILISTLNENSPYKRFKNLIYIEKTEQLIVRHKKGLAFWNLKKTFPNFSYPNVDIGGCSVLISQDYSQMWFDQDEDYLRKIEFGKAMKQLKSMRFNQDMIQKQILSSGDFIEIRRDEVYSGAQSESQREQKEEEVEFFLSNINNDDEEERFENGKSLKQNRYGIWYKLILVPFDKMLEFDQKKYNRVNYHLQNESSEIEIYSSKKKITCFSVISSLGLDKPNILDNEKVKANPFYIQEKLSKNNAANFVEVRFGTSDGKCLAAELLFDKEGTLITKNVNEVIQSFNPVNLSTSTVFNASKGKRKGSFREQFDTASKEYSSQLTMSHNQNTVWPMNSFVKFPDVDLEAFLYLENRGVKDSYGSLDIVLCVLARQSNNDWAKIEIQIDSEILNPNESKFSLIQMDSNVVKERFIRFAAYGPLGIASLQFDISEQKLTVLGFLEKILKVAPNYSEKQDSFFIPSDDTILIYNGSLNLLTHTIDTDDEVKSQYLILGPKEKLLIYDRVYYYEFEIESLRFQKKTRIFPADSLEESTIPFNFKVFKPGEVLTIPHLGQEVNEISFTPDVEPLDLHRFPFTALLKCFDKEDYTKPILEYADYYFEQIKQSKSDDLYYGPLNPIIFAIYHHDINLIEVLLEEYEYPRSVLNYWSPLSFAFRFNYQSCIKELCEKLVNRKYDIQFARQDFLSLLRSGKSYCEQLMATIPSKPEIQNFPKMLYMNNQFQLYFVKDTDEVLMKLKKHENSIEKKKSKKSKKSGDPEESKPRKKSMIEIYRSVSLSSNEGLLSANDLAVQANLDGITQTKKETTTYELPFLYDFKLGSNDSIQFLFTYSNSSTEEFVTSQWKELIKFKWRNHRLVHVIFSIVYFIFTITTTVYLVYKPSNITPSKVFTIIFLFALMFFEFLQMFSYFFFGFLEYITDFWNYIDWGIFVLFLIFIFGEGEGDESEANKAIAPILLVLIYYRNFSHLRVINQFTTLVGMINIIIQKLAIFFIIMIYFYLSTAFIMIRVLPDQKKLDSFEYSYLWTLFGAIEKDDFDSSPYTVIAIAFGTIIVTIIQLNILIAYLSNVFSRLEEQQNVNDLKEKAGMILDMEIISWFFKIKMTGKIKKLKKFEEYQNDLPVIALSKDKSIHEELSEEENAFLANRSKLFIIKSTEADDEDDNDGHNDSEQIIVHKMKILTSKFTEFVERYDKDHEQMENKMKTVLKNIDKK